MSYIFIYFIITGGKNRSTPRTPKYKEPLSHFISGTIGRQSLTYFLNTKLLFALSRQSEKVFVVPMLSGSPKRLERLRSTRVSLMLYDILSDFLV